MPSDCISFRDTNYFSGLICDYLDQKESLQTFYNRFPNIENFKAQINDKQMSFRAQSRNLLTDELLNQYKQIETSDATLKNIESLRQENTFTITTGHQLNLFTGPLYFLYKIVSTINLTKELKAKYPEYNFVPVYWMATEDHDFDEINFFKFKGKKLQWNRESSGAVGRLQTEGLDAVLEVLKQQLGISKNASWLAGLFENAYLKHSNLADATRYLANELFKDYGLVIIDADSKPLKQLFIPYVEKELTQKISFEAVTKTNAKIETENYSVQVNPREINLFYLKDNLRERIIESKGQFQVNNSSIKWSQEEILSELQNHPERFSPNVIMRPLYQEVILPNLCYIGGGGEMAYWFQLKSYFEKVEVPFPVLLLRNSALLITKKQTEKLEKLNLSIKDVFKKQGELINEQTKLRSDIEIDFSEQKQHLRNQFRALHDLADKTDKSFLGAVSAQERKQIKGLEHLEKRLLKAQRKQLQDVLERITTIQDQLFPSQSLQERSTNFSEFYLEFGHQLIEQLVLNLQPLKSEFIILEFN